MDARRTTRLTRVIATGALTTMAILAVACGGDDDASSDRDAEFNQRVSTENLDVDTDFARQQSQNTCTDLAESTNDPANVDPIEVYSIVQKIAVRTGMSEDDAVTLVGLGIDIYCPEYKASWNR